MNKTLIGIIVVLMIISAALGGYIFAIKSGHVELKERVSSGKDSVLTYSNLPDTLVEYEKGNFRFSPPESWEEVDIKNLSLPSKIYDPVFAFRPSESNCVVAYAKFEDISHSDEYPQITYDQGIDSVDLDLYIKWLMDPIKGTFRGFSKEPPQTFLPYEVLLTQYPTTYYGGFDRDVFVLYAEKENVITDVCREEFESMIGTLERAYETTTIEDYSTGILYFQTMRIEGKSRTEQFDTELENKLFFKDAKTGISKILSEIPLEMYDMSVYGDDIYFINIDRDLYRLNLFDQVPVKVFDSDEPVNTFFIAYDTIYYLAGPWCQDYLVSCNLNLYAYDLYNRLPALLASNIDARDFIGLDDFEDRLYFAHTEGDGGCTWSTYSYFDFKTRSASKFLDVGYCEGDSDAETESAQVEALLDRLDYESNQVQYLTLQNGIVGHGTPETSQSEGWETIRYSE